MKVRELKHIIPELFLVVSIIYYWTLTSSIFNPIAIALLVALAYQILSGNSSSGLIISGSVIALSLFMVLALLSELSEFNVIEQNWKNLVFFGALYLGLNIIMAGLMFTKYFKLKLN